MHPFRVALDFPPMSTEPGTAQRIRDYLGQVEHLRDQVSSPAMAAAIAAIKQLQSLRFCATYADFLASPRHEAATRFFLDELYGEHDFSERDAQFGRIASGIENLFPAAVGQLAIDLAETHALSERLDHEMARHWLALGDDLADSERYVQCWRATGEPAHRSRQLAVVLHMGQELQRLTRIKSLLIALKMMRKPSRLAGLSSLQHFLERGFEAFAAMGSASEFLAAIETREHAWITAMFEVDLDTCARRLARDLAAVRTLA